MQLPKRIAISRPDIKTFLLKFPSGKEVFLKWGKPAYETNDTDEIDFASRQKGLGVFDLDDQELRAFVTNLKVDPSVENPSLTPSEADEFRWIADRENVVADHLRKLGYLVEKGSPVEAVEEDDTVDLFAEPEQEEKPKPKRRSRKKKAVEE